MGFGRVVFFILIIGFTSLSQAEAPNSESQKQESLTKAIALASSLLQKTAETVNLSYFKEWNIDPEIYRSALNQGEFYAPYWSKSVKVKYVIGTNDTPLCDTSKAYVEHEELNSRELVSTLVVCPGFFTYPHMQYQAETILHELVHVVTGPDECRAFAYAYTIIYFALSEATLNERLWSHYNCDSSTYNIFK